LTFSAYLYDLIRVFIHWQVLHIALISVIYYVLAKCLVFSSTL